MKLADKACRIDEEKSEIILLKIPLKVLPSSWYFESILLDLDNILFGGRFYNFFVFNKIALREFFIV